MSKAGSKIGPGVLVTAAFVGPGTVTTSTLAGANFGYALIWVLVRLGGNCGFYGHTRIGQLGEPFTCWKICTMHPDAEQLNITNDLS